MPKAKSLTEMSLAEIEKKFGVKAKRGILSAVRNKYYFTVEGKKYELDPQSAISTQPLDKFIGKETVAGGIIIDGRVIVIIVIGPGTFFKPIILCYIPIPDIRVKIDKVIRTTLIKELVLENRLPTELGKQLIDEINLKVQG